MNRLGFLIGLSAKQSNSHRESARYLRGVGLNIKALDPFLASLDVADQKALKKSLTSLLFGQAYVPSKKNDVHLSEVDISKIVESLSKNFNVRVSN